MVLLAKLLDPKNKMPSLKLYELNWLLDVPRRDSISITTEMLDRASTIKRWLTERDVGDELGLTPIERYVSLHEAVVAAHTPHVGFKNRLIREGAHEVLGDKDNNLVLNQEIVWRITWDELIVETIPDKQIIEFCGFLFATTLLSMVRYWEVFDMPKGGWSPFDHERSNNSAGEFRIKNPHAQPNYDFDFRFDKCLESCLHPVFGILSGSRFVIQPDELPMRVLRKSFIGNLDQELDLLWKSAADQVLEECRRQIERSGDSERGGRLLDRYRFHLKERYGLTGKN